MGSPRRRSARATQRRSTAALLQLITHGLLFVAGYSIGLATFIVVNRRFVRLGRTRRVVKAALLPDG